MSIPGAGSGQPIIIIKKKRKKRHEPHHAGAWKVAYADFVTAMMAFFLLLWLLNVTTKEQREGIADYFSPSSVSRQTSGSGSVLGGLTITVPGAMISPGAPIAVRTPVQTRPGEQATRPTPTEDDSDYDQAGKTDKMPDEEQIAEAQARAEAEHFAEAERKLLETLGGIPELANLTKNLVIDQTPDGLRIQIVDEANHVMFPLGSAQMYPQTKQLLEQVAKVVAQLPNKLSISGHTDSTPFAKGDVYSNWELSTDRANASRRVLVAAGIAQDRIATVVGKADREHLAPETPGSPRNRRISIVLLRERATAAHTQTGQPAGTLPLVPTAAPAPSPTR